MPENNLSMIDFKTINKKAKAFAKQAVIDMRLPDAIELPKTIYTMGPKLQRIYNRHYEDLNKNGNSKKISLSVANALKLYWESCHDSGETMRLQFEALGYKSLNETQKLLSTATGYANYEGWAYTLYNGAFSSDKKNHQQDELVIMALYWLFEAEKIKNYELKFDYISEALDALMLSNGSYMWDEGYKCKSEDISNEKSLAAKKAHQENYQLRSEAKSYWLSNIDPKLSNDAAAIQLMKVVPFSLRTLSSYVSEFKKEIQSASKA